MKNDDADGDGVAGECCGTEDADDADEADPKLVCAMAELEMPVNETRGRRQRTPRLRRIWLRRMRMRSEPREKAVELVEHPILRPGKWRARASR